MKEKIVLSLVFLLTLISSFGQSESTNSYHHGIEIFPATIPFHIYSLQYVYGMTEKDYLIVGFTYLNNYYPNKKQAIGRFYAPTLPIGYRRFIWKKLNVEGQLWPAYDFYKDLKNNKFYNGFDLAGSLRLGYLFDFNVMKKRFYTNLQVEYIFGIYGGNKPDNFDDVEESLNIFPVLSIGYKW